MPHWQKLLVLVSFVGMIVALYVGDYLTIPAIVAPAALIASMPVLFLAFIAWCLSWRSLLNASSYPIRTSTAIASTGLPVFGKYLPGKVWMIVGRAAHVAHANQYPLGLLSAFAFKAQLIDLWTGLLLGCIGLYVAGGLWKWGLVPLSAWAALTIILFMKAPRQLIGYLVKRVFHRDPGLERLGSATNMIGATFWSLATWLMLAAGFHLLALALVDRPLHWSVGFAFPLAGALGIMAFIVPGGVGVREGVLAAFLTMTGLNLAEAGSVAIASRLWYLAGELFIFGCGLASIWLPHRATKRDEPYVLRK